MQLRGPVITATHLPQLQLRALDAIVYISVKISKRFSFTE